MRPLLELVRPRRFRIHERVFSHRCHSMVAARIYADNMPAGVLPGLEIDIGID